MRLPSGKQKTPLDAIPSNCLIAHFPAAIRAPQGNGRNFARGSRSAQCASEKWRKAWIIP